MRRRGNEGQYLKVKNWDKYQTYTDRRPLWVKFHIELLDDYELTALPVNARLVYDYMLLLAARHENWVAYDVSYIASAVRLRHQLVGPALKTLIETGFLEVHEQSNSRAAADQRLTSGTPAADQRLTSGTPAADQRLTSGRAEHPEMAQPSGKSDLSSVHFVGPSVKICATEEETEEERETDMEALDVGPTLALVDAPEKHPSELIEKSLREAVA